MPYDDMTNNIYSVSKVAPPFRKFPRLGSINNTHLESLGSLVSVKAESPSLPELMGSLKLGIVWVFVQLIHRPTRTKNQVYKNINIA